VHATIHVPSKLLRRYVNAITALVAPIPPQVCALGSILPTGNGTDAAGVKQALFCLPCPPGFYRSDPSSTTCTQCPKGMPQVASM
jgi:hypothetical protein